MQLIEAAEEHIDVLVFAGLFLPDGYPELAKVLIAKAEQGAAIRLALGDPDSEAVRLRGEEEHIGEGMAARVRLSLTYLDEAIGAPGVELRLHTTTLYNSIYRFDDDMLVNAHVYGAPAAQSPVLHLRRLAGGRCSTTTRRHSSGCGRRQARPLRSLERGAPMARIDYYNDPNAPKANSLVPSVTAIVPNEHGAILMVHKTDNDLWALPGGGMDVGESMADTVVREVKEETGHRRRGHRPGRHLHQPQPRHGLRRRRGPPAVLDLLHHPDARRPARHQQRDQGSPVRRSGRPGRAEHPPVDAAADRPLPRAPQHALHRLIGHGRQPRTGPIDRRPQQRMRAADGPVHRVIRRIALQDLGDALLEVDGLPGRAGGHVGEGERVQQRPVLGLELGQRVHQAALLGLEPGPEWWATSEARRSWPCWRTYRAPSTGWKPSRFSDGA